jgi:hypothetical protein
LARADIVGVDCLRPDGIGADDDTVLTSLAQFDVLSNIVAVVDAGEASGRTFYPSFARLRQDRIQPLVEQLLSDASMRDALHVGNDESLSIALKKIGDQAVREGWVADGFRGWDHTPVATFIARHLPASIDDGE